MISLSKVLKERQFSQLTALLLLLLVLVVGALPGYMSGRFSWREPPAIANLQELKQIRHQGLNIPGWKTTTQEEKNIGGRKWSYQTIKKEGDKTEVGLLLLPQNGPKDQPQVEWTELQSWQQWDIAQSRDAEFSIPQGNNSSVKVSAKYFRAYSDEKTLAVLQWYAWKDGGYPSPWRWFVADQMAQWQKHRVPWVAVCILLPMESFGQVEKVWSQAQSIGEIVQAALIKNVF